VWWGTDSQGVDRVAVRAGHVLSWPTGEACAQAAGEAGWVGLRAADGDETIGQSAFDFRPTMAWLRGQRCSLDPVSALNLWNFSGDITASTGGPPWPVFSRLASQCHSKLTVANVPWLAGRADYQPRWTAVQLRCVRQELNHAVHVLRTQLPELMSGP